MSQYLIIMLYSIVYVLNVNMGKQDYFQEVDHPCSMSVFVYVLNVMQKLLKVQGYLLMVPKM